MPSTANSGLPVDAILPQLADLLVAGNRAIVVAAPGAGKTTRVPPFLLSQSWCAGRVLVLEPRRIAARAAAGHVARSLGGEPGGMVGYRVRFETRVGPATRVEYLTEGVFTRMALDDPELKGVSAVLFDEYHERHLETDLAMALCLDIQEALRPDLRLLVMSATIDTARLSRLLGGAPAIESAGRAFPVALRHEPRLAGEPVEKAVARLAVAALRTESGSILAFLPGQAEIRRAEQLLAPQLPAGTTLHCLHGALGFAEQDAAIRPAMAGQRKVVLATSIAETSLTIEGVRVVIDCGLARVPRYDPRSGFTRLETVRASRFSVEQRAGRAGRTGPGVAIRLWLEAQTGALEQSSRPEILDADLSGLALDLAHWGVADPAAMRFADAPPAAAWREATALLKRLGAIDEAGALTADGRAMRGLAVPPRYAAMIARAARFGQAGDAALLALLAGERGLGGESPDLAVRLERLKSERAPRAAAVRKLAGSMAAAVASFPQAPKRDYSAGALLSLAWPERIAQRRGEGFRLAGGGGAAAPRDGDFARCDWLAIAELQGAAASARIAAAAQLDLSEIMELHAGAIVETREVAFDEGSGAVRARRLRRLGELRLAEGPAEATGEETAAALIAAIRKLGLASLTFAGAASRLRARMRHLHAQDEAGWPNVGDESLLAGLEIWLGPFLAGANSLGAIGVGRLVEGLRFLLASFGADVARLDREAPEHFRTPAGSNLPLDYADTGVRLSVRVQELYGMKTHPLVAGRPVTLELLSPAGRPIQVTTDLPGFWRGSWRAVRTEMRGRYPRHVWPQDPQNAVPTARAKPRAR
jgi:ATP-dependent helicase HrpB